MRAAKSFQVHVSVLQLFSLSNIGSGFVWLLVNFAGREKVLESLSYKTSQFDEVIFCYVNNISGFQFISAQAFVYL